MRPSATWLSLLNVAAEGRKEGRKERKKERKKARWAELFCDRQVKGANRMRRWLCWRDGRMKGRERRANGAEDLTVEEYASAQSACALNG
ncbi:hypothetical protein MHYP_G00244650 [Metynnis hypsauchen]